MAAGPLHEEPEAASPDPAPMPGRLHRRWTTGPGDGYNGHVDLGTGIRTALAQIVAEELDVAVGSVDMVLGHTGLVPNQGGTIASETIQVTANPAAASRGPRPRPLSSARRRNLGDCRPSLDGRCRGDPGAGTR